jgi:hypothetical protein
LYTGNRGSGVFGTCYTSFECRRRQGQAEGTCAAGFGVCCVFDIPCNSEEARINDDIQTLLYKFTGSLTSELLSFEAKS